MNVAWMVEQAGTLGAFPALGIGLPLLLPAAIVVLVVRRGWSR